MATNDLIEMNSNESGNNTFQTLPPWARPNQAQRRPIVQRGRQVRLPPLAWALAGVSEPGDQQPTEDQTMPRLGAAKVPLERVEALGYCAWEAGETPHVSRSGVFWEVSCIQHTQERCSVQAFFGEMPAAEVCSPVTFEPRGSAKRHRLAVCEPDAEAYAFLLFHHQD
jgi:hypothetical protein